MKRWAQSSIKNDAEESLSIGYRVKKCRYESRTRIIEKVDILEISIDSKELKLNKWKLGKKKIIRD